MKTSSVMSRLRRERSAAFTPLRSRDDLNTQKNNVVPEVRPGSGVNAALLTLYQQPDLTSTKPI